MTPDPTVRLRRDRPLTLLDFVVWVFSILTLWALVCATGAAFVLQVANG
jgi:hypothetical protein